MPAVSKMQNQHIPVRKRRAEWRQIWYKQSSKKRKENLFTSIIEGIEGGDYFDFLKEGRKEMESRFADLKIIDVGKRAAWYINTVAG